jgi:mannose-6-phosphate isomerase-like protein (cupin superfamily)
MAKKSLPKKSASRAAARSATQKRSPLKAVAIDKAPAKPRARNALNGTSRTAPMPRLPKQRIAISHLREEDFKADGLRSYAQYRDLGIVEATHGLARAHVIRLLPPCNPQEVSKLHTHDVEFQMVYVLKGWVKSYLEGVGETLMKQGSVWTQPPRVKHMILDYSDDVELLEVILPADFKTVELTA